MDPYSDIEEGEIVLDASQIHSSTPFHSDFVSSLSSSSSTSSTSSTNITASTFRNHDFKTNLDSNGNLLLFSDSVVNVVPLVPEECKETETYSFKKEEEGFSESVPESKSDSDLESESDSDSSSTKNSDSSNEDEDEENQHPIDNEAFNEREVETDSSYVSSDSDLDGVEEDLEEEDEEEEDMNVNNGMEEEDTPFEPIHLIIPPDVSIAPLGKICQFLKTQILVESFLPGDRSVLDVGTPILWNTKQVLGQIKDTFGPVYKPYYVVQLCEPIDSTKFNELVYHIPDYSIYALTEQLKAMKGCDASNRLDQEVESDELEFSDDEQEKAYMEKLKEKRPKFKRKPSHSSSSRTPHKNRTTTTTTTTTTTSTATSYKKIQPFSGFHPSATTNNMTLPTSSSSMSQFNVPKYEPLFEDNTTFSNINDFTEIITPTSTSTTMTGFNAPSFTYPTSLTPSFTTTLPSHSNLPTTTTTTFPLSCEPLPYPDKMVPRHRIKVLAPGVIGVERTQSSEPPSSNQS